MSPPSNDDRDDLAKAERAFAASAPQRSIGAAEAECARRTRGRCRAGPLASGYSVRVRRAERGDRKILADVLAPIEETARRAIANTTTRKNA